MLCLIIALIIVSRQQAEMKVIRWMCCRKVPDRFTCNELRTRLAIVSLFIQVVLDKWSLNALLLVL